MALASGSTITINYTDFEVPAAGANATADVGFSEGALLSGTASSGTLRLTLTGTVAAGAAAKLSFAVTNPAPKTVAKAGLTLATTQVTTAVASSADIVITPPTPAITNVTFSVSPTTPGASATMTVGFTSPTLLRFGDTITVNTGGFALTPGSITATRGVGFDSPVSFSATGTASQVVITLGGSGGLVANTAGTLTFPVTNPGAGTIAKAGLTVATSRDTTPVASDRDIVIGGETARPSLYFLAGTPVFASVGDPVGIVKVGFHRADGSVDTTPAARVTLSSTPAGLIGTLAGDAQSGVASFTNLVFPAAGSYSLVASATGYNSATLALRVQVKASAPTKIVFTTSPPASTNAGQGFNLEVAVQDKDSVTVLGATGVVTLSYTATTGSGTLSAATTQGLSVTPVNGVASFTGLKIGTSATSATGTITATYGAFTVRSTAVTATRTLAYIAFSAVPTFETTGTTFSIAPVVTAYATDGTPLTTQTGDVTLSASAATGNVSTVALSAATGAGGLTAVLTNGVATFPGLKATGGTGLYLLTATLARASGTPLSVSVNFSLYATSTAASTAAAKSQQGQPSVHLTVESTASRLTTEASIRSDLCLTAGLTLANCKIQVSIAKATEQTASTVMVPDDVVRAAQVAPGDTSGGNEVTISALVLASLERATGVAPAGTSILSAFGLSARDPQGLPVERPSTGAFRVSLLVAASEVLPSALPGDLKAGAWDSSAKRWVYLPAQVQKNADGSFTITTTVDFYGVVAVIYAPGAGRIAAFNGYSTDGSGFGVFEGGYVDDLASAAAQNEADGVWAQDSLGLYRLLVVNGPAFLSKDFREAFAGGVQVNSAVTLMQTRAATTPVASVTPAASAPAAVAPAAAAPAVTSTGATSTYTVTATDTLSGISARFGVSADRIAAANGLVGPAFVVRTGQVLTIPAAGGSSSYTVTGTDTLSGIGARFNIDWMRIAEANGIAGPNYLVRAGQVLNIPAR
ncbi:MAG: LysM peptidoglycan-binding domain-containing protein [Chloroflexota bacterium]